MLLNINGVCVFRPGTQLCAQVDLLKSRDNITCARLQCSTVSAK